MWPLISEAFESGALGLDKVVELTQFATPETKARVLRWAQRVSGAAIRRKGDLEARQQIEELQEAETHRFLEWWYTDDRFGLRAELPAAQGAVVAKALERLAETIPVMPGEGEGPYSEETRRADALVALCSARTAADPDPNRGTVVIHAQLEELMAGTGGCEIEDGPVIHPETARRLLCNARIQTVIEDDRGEVVRLGRMRREPPAWMLRQLKHRGGRTELENLALICSFHHKLVHELGWTMSRDADGEFGWFQPDGVRYRAGPAPPVIEEAAS